MITRSEFTPLLLAVIVLYFSTNAIVPFLLYGRELGPAEGDSSVVTLLRIVLYPVAALVIAPNLRSIVDSMRRVPFLSALILLAPLSILWSTAPEVTFRSSVSLLASSILGVCIALRFSEMRLMAVFGGVFLLVIATSLVAAAMFPEWGITEDPRGVAINGVFNTKGQMGRMMVLSALFFLVLSFSKSRGRALSIFLAASSTVLVFFSQSQTSILVVLLLIPALLFLYLLRWHWLLSVWMLVALLTLAAVVLYNLQAVLSYITESMGRDTSLTGRTDLWSLIEKFIEERPLLGYGYDSFWRDGSGRADAIWSYMGQYIPHAHNGYLEVMLGLGLVGLALVLLVLLTTFVQAVNRSVSGQSPFAFYSVIVVLFTLISNVAEVSLLSRNSFYWVIVVICAARLAQPMAVELPSTLASSHVDILRSAQALEVSQAALCTDKPIARDYSRRRIAKNAAGVQWKPR